MGLRGQGCVIRDCVIRDCEIGNCEIRDCEVCVDFNWFSVGAGAVSLGAGFHLLVRPT